MTCEKCKIGEMLPTSIQRFSGCLVAIGLTVLIPAILGILFATFIAVTGMFAFGSSTSQVLDKSKVRAAQTLATIDGLPSDYISDFEADGSIDTAALDQLTPPVRRQVDRVLDSYHAQVAGSAIGTTLGAGVGTAFVVAVYFVSIPTLVLGLVLLLRKKVWKCRNCGYVFDRA